MSDYTKDPFERCDGKLWSTVIDINEDIGRHVGMMPKQCYDVGTACSVVMNPLEPSWLPGQKSECERWIAEHKDYCEREGYTLQLREYWPLLHRDWNALMLAYSKMAMKGVPAPTPFPLDIKEAWLRLALACGVSVPAQVLDYKATQG